MMPVQTATELRKILYDAYDGFADKRYKDPERDAPFIVDDRTERDLDARKQLFLWFCQIFATVENATQVRLVFRGDVPMSEDVRAWVDEQQAEESNFGFEVVVTPDNLAALDDLASRMRAIIARPYDTKSYKYVVPRTSRSIARLRGILHSAWS